MPHTLQIKATTSTSNIQEVALCTHTTSTTALLYPLISMNRHAPTISIFRTTPPYSHPLSMEGKIPFRSPNTKSLMQTHPPKPSLLSSKLHTIIQYKTKGKNQIRSKIPNSRLQQEWAQCVVSSSHHLGKHHPSRQTRSHSHLS